MLLFYHQFYKVLYLIKSRLYCWTKLNSRQSSPWYKFCDFFLSRNQLQKMKILKSHCLKLPLKSCGTFLPVCFLYKTCVSVESVSAHTRPGVDGGEVPDVGEARGDPDTLCLSCTGDPKQGWGAPGSPTGLTLSSHCHCPRSMCSQGLWSWCYLPDSILLHGRAVQRPRQWQMLI